MRTSSSSHDGDSGAVLPVVALTLVTLVAMSAMTIDLGQLWMKRRDIQKIADVASLDLVRDLDGSTKNLYAPGQVKNGPMAAHLIQSVQRNGGDPTKATYTFDVGCVSGKGQAFKTDDISCPVPNAVRVTGTDSVNYAFAPVIGQTSGSTTRSAVSTIVPQVNFEVGSVLSTVTPFQAAVLNNVVCQQVAGPAPPLGTCPWTITAAGWQGLASAQVTLAQVATKMGLASADQLYSGSINAKAYLQGLSDAANANGCAGCVPTIVPINSSTPPQSSFPLSSFATVGTGNNSYANASISVLTLITGAASAINGTNAVSVPGLNVGLPAGIGSVDVSLQGGTPMHFCGWHGLNEPAINACKTAQITIGITLHVANMDLSGNPTLASLVSPVLNGPFTVNATAAGATATPTAVGCPSGLSPSATISLTADPITATATESLTLSAAGLPILKVSQSSSSVSTTSNSGSALFAYTSEFLPPKGGGSTKRVGSASLDLGATLNSPPAQASALGNPLPLPLGTLTYGLNQIIATGPETIAELPAPAGPTLSDYYQFVLGQVTQSLGIEFGGGDIGAFDLRCTTPQLAG